MALNRRLKKRTTTNAGGVLGRLKLAVLMYWEICEGEGSIIFRVLT
jgi:hypothetical protein